jgi:N-acyl homoserine lactone hydrolase
LQHRYRVVILSGGNSLRSSSNNERARSRMTVKLYAFTCGTVTGEFAHLMEGGEGELTVPIPVFLIEHPKGRALFDTGLHPDCQSDPAGRLGSRLAGLFRIGFQPGEEVSARLEAIDRDPGKIDLIINSHFHFDHVGGNALIPNATMLVQRGEWDAGVDPETAARRGFNPRILTLDISCGSSMASTTSSGTARW